MSKKIQTIISDNIAKEIETVIREDRFIDQSEFIRHCIREYLNHRELKVKELEAIINEFDQMADDLLNDHCIDEGKLILDKIAPLKTYLKGRRESKTSNRDRIKLLRDIILEMQAKYKNGVPLKEIIKKTEEYSCFNSNNIEDMINKLKSAGEIIESSSEKFKVV